MWYSSYDDVAARFHLGHKLYSKTSHLEEKSVVLITSSDSQITVIITTHYIMRGRKVNSSSLDPLYYSLRCDPTMKSFKTIKNSLLSYTVTYPRTSKLFILSN